MSQISQTEGFPIKELLRLYSLGRKFLYLNYFKQFKLILAWIGPINLQSEGLDLSPIPWYIGNYEVQELAVLIGCKQELIVHYLEILRKESQGTNYGNS